MNVKQQTMALTATVEKYKRNLMKRKTWYHGNQTTLYIFVLRFYLSFTISNTQLISLLEQRQLGNNQCIVTAKNHIFI